MSTVIDLMTRFPLEIWFEENPKAADTKLEENILNLVTSKILLLLDRGFYHYFKLIVAPFPNLQRGSDEFFFNNSLKAS
jgi:hypothetical protein